MAVWAMTSTASAQVLRLGPFDFFAQTGLEFIYTTNVEEERPSQSTAEREDIYGIWTLDLKSTAEFHPRTTVQIDTGIAIEKHVNRTDLDNSENPFGRIDARFDTDFTPILLYGGYRYERTSESADDVFVPGSRKRRQVGTTRESELGVDFILRNFRSGASYTYTEERYDDEDFQDGEQNETSIDFYADLTLWDSVILGYEYERTRTELINDPEQEPEWDSTTTISITFDRAFRLIRRPEITYSLGLEREDVDGEDTGWQLTHTFMAQDSWDITPVLNLRVMATYEIKDEKQEDEVLFDYGAFLVHEITESSRQELYVTRQPVSTFGSTQDTDEQEFGYRFQNNSFFLPDLSFSASAVYTISDPVSGDTERLWKYEVGLSHRKALSQRLNRALSYRYSQEDSNLEDELLEVHEVSLAFTYDF